MNKQRKLKKTGIFSLSAITLAVASFASVQVQAADLEKVTYNMAWLPQGSSIGIIVAQEQGIFKEYGLDVNIVRGYGGNRTANELDQGQYEFGYVDPVSLMLNISNGGNIKMVGALNTQWPAGVCFNKDKNDIKTIDDLEGLSMGGGSASPVQNVVPAWLELNNKPKDFIKLLRMDPAVIDASFVEGRIDLAECWRASNREVILKRAKDADVNVGWLEYSDFNLDAYGSGIATRSELIEKDPEMISKFLKGSYEGYEFAIKNPEKANEIMLKMFPVVDAGVALEQIKNMNDLIQDSTVADKGLGYMKPERWESTVKFIKTAYPETKDIDSDSVYTNELIKK